MQYIQIQHYNKEHTIHHCFVNGRVNLFFLNSNDSKKKYHDDARMKEKVLKVYNLTEQTLQNYPTAAELIEYITQLEEKYLCHPDTITAYNDNNGIKYVEEQKQKFLSASTGNKITSTELTAQSNYELLMTQTIEDCMNINSRSSASHIAKLPVLEMCKTILNLSVYRQSYEPALNKTLCIIVQQGFSTVTHLIQAMCDIGIPPKNIILITKPHTTTRNNDRNFSTLASSLGFNYISSLVENQQEHQSINPGEYQDLLEKAIDRLKQCAQSILSSHPDIKNIILHDEGSTLIKSVVLTETLNDWRDRYHLTTSEHTVSGLAARQVRPLDGPCISMARSCIKTEYEAIFIAELSFKKIKSKIEELIQTFSIHNKRPIISVIGCGNIGSEFIKLLVHHFSAHIDLRISEVENNDSEKFAHIKRLLPPTAIYTSSYDTADNTTAKLIKCSNIVFGCTGKDITGQWQNAISEQSHSCVLVSLTSGTREFQTLLNDFAKDKHLAQGNLSLDIANSGFPIIFDGQDDAIHPFKIQIIRALTLCAIVQQLSHLTLSEKMEKSTAKNQAIKIKYNKNSVPFTALDGVLQLYILETFKKFQSIYNQTVEQCEEISLPNCDFSLESIINLSQGKEQMKMDNTEPNPYNYFAKFDKNHHFHLLQTNGKLQFRFSKHGKTGGNDSMLNKLLSQFNFNMDTFQAASIFEKLNLIEKIASNSSNKSSYKGQFFNASTYSMASSEKYDAVKNSF